MSVIYGVPSCTSVIAPFLFAAHMGFLQPLNPSTHMTKYADDVVYAILVNLTDISKLLTNEINHVTSWCSSHGLQLNNQKTKLMIPTKTKAQTSYLGKYELSTEQNPWPHLHH